MPYSYRYLISTQRCLAWSVLLSQPWRGRASDQSSSQEPEPSGDWSLVWSKSYLKSQRKVSDPGWTQQAFPFKSLVLPGARCSSCKLVSVQTSQFKTRPKPQHQLFFLWDGSSLPGFRGCFPEFMNLQFDTGAASASKLWEVLVQIKQKQWEWGVESLQRSSLPATTQTLTATPSEKP